MSLSQAETRRAGLEALARASGPVHRAHFLRQSETGSGNYSEKRHALLDSDRLFPGLAPMSDRRERRKRWVQRGQYAVEVEIEVVYPEEAPSEPCLEPATVRWLNEIAKRAEAGDVGNLRSVGRVYQALPS